MDFKHQFSWRQNPQQKSGESALHTVVPGPSEAPGQISVQEEVPLSGISNSSRRQRHNLISITRDHEASHTFFESPLALLPVSAVRELLLLTDLPRADRQSEALPIRIGVRWTAGSLTDWKRLGFISLKLTRLLGSHSHWLLGVCWEVFCCGLTPGLKPPGHPTH